MEIPHMEAREANLLNPLQLAYMGDAVWETMVRTRLILQHMNVHHMHSECVKKVNAAAQAQIAALLLDQLSSEETDVYLRGRNAHARHPSPKNQNPADYADSTGFEALIGFLFLTGREERLQEIADRAWEGEQEHA